MILCRVLISRNSFSYLLTCIVVIGRSYLIRNLVIDWPFSPLVTSYVGRLFLLYPKIPPPPISVMMIKIQIKFYVLDKNIFITKVRSKFFFGEILIHVRNSGQLLAYFCIALYLRNNCFVILKLNNCQLFRQYC